WQPNHRLPQRKSPGWRCRPSARTTACIRHERPAPRSDRRLQRITEPAVGAPVHRQRCHSQGQVKVQKRLRTVRWGYVDGMDVGQVRRRTGLRRITRGLGALDREIFEAIAESPTPLLDTMMPPLTRAAAFAVGVGLENASLGLPLALLAGLVGLSRVATGAHYPGDVIAGFGIGATVAVLGARLAPPVVRTRLPMADPLRVETPPRP